ncbi:MAG: hypothetical protein ABIS36_05490 [Chryseolinea sp.]
MAPFLTLADANMLVTPLKSQINQIIRVGSLVMVLVICLGCIAMFFWNQELRYQLPTPIPPQYQAVAVGQHVFLPARFDKNRAHFIHFYNPECPCARFNAQHLKTLIGQFKDSISISIIVPTPADIKKAKSEFGDIIEITSDSEGTIAKACGVYSTPQAAIIDKKSSLYYRGNYNSSRYCTSRATNFAELSLIALINNNPSPSYGLLATQSYGCELNDSSQVNFISF